MADSVTSIWNMALANIGSTSQVLNPTENTKAATQCNLWWPNARDSVLRWFPWPFATVTVTLQQVAGFTPPDYRYAFALPSDCLKALELLSPAGRRPPPGLRIPWVIRALPAPGGGTSRILCTDLAPGQAADLGGFDAGDGEWDWLSVLGGGLQSGTAMPCLRYTSRVEDVTVYPPEVDDAMAWQLSSYLAMPMTQGKDMKAWAEKMARASITAAAALNLNEQQADPPLDSDPGMARR